MTQIPLHNTNNHETSSLHFCCILPLHLMGVILVVFYKENEGLGIITGGVREIKTYSGALERKHQDATKDGY